MKNNRATGRSTPALMPLEPRRMLAGNVTVVWSDDGSFDGLLTITGDNKANQFVVSQTEDTTITGLNGTKINGSSDVFEFDFWPNLAIATGNGNDEVEVVDLFAGLTASTGNGDDIVQITVDEFVPLAFEEFEIDTGNGDDFVLLSELACFECDMNIRMGNGDDTVKLEGIIEMFGLFGPAGVATIDMGRGSDTIDATLLVDFISPDPVVVIGNETVLT